MKIHFTKEQLKALDKEKLFYIFHNFVCDEYPIGEWRNRDKPTCVRLILQGPALLNPLRQLPDAPDEIEFNVPSWMKDETSKMFNYPKWLEKFEV